MSILTNASQGFPSYEPAGTCEWRGQDINDVRDKSDIIFLSVSLTSVLSYVRVPTFTADLLSPANRCLRLPSQRYLLRLPVRDCISRSRICHGRLTDLANSAVPALMNVVSIDHFHTISSV